MNPVLRFASLTLLLLAAALPAGDDKKATGPAPGAVYVFSPTQPKHVTADIEFRDPSETMWPVFFYGKPVEGSLVFAPAGPSAAFTVQLDKMPQKNGDQSRKILGEWLKPGEPPAASLVVERMSALQTVQEEKRGKRDSATFEGHWTVGAKRFPFKAEGVLRYQFDKNGTTCTDVYIDLKWSTTGKAIGLTHASAQGAIDIRATVQAVLSKDAGRKK